MEKITPFDIPLLNNEICQYLTRQDLTHCILVSKTWATWFSPALWRDLDCRGRTPDTVILDRQREHIRVVRNISMGKARNIREHLGLLRLQRLEFDGRANGYGVHRAAIRVLPVLERISTLQHLQIFLTLDHDSICQQWLRTLEVLPRLESLCLSCGGFVEGHVIPKILQLCHRVKRLSLEFLKKKGFTQEEDKQEYKDARETIRDMPEMRLVELSFRPGIKLVEKFILQPLLERCPRMERLDLGSTRLKSTIGHLSKTLRENKLPKLRHFIVGEFSERRFRTAFADVLSRVECGMESLDYQNDLNWPIIRSLLQHHSHSLTKLTFHGVAISIWTHSQLMAGLPCLQSYTGAIQTFHTQPSRGIPLHRRWECVSLRYLRLHLRGFGSDAIGGLRWAESKAKPRLDYVFSEIANLTRLQELIIECDLKNLFLKRHGYLAQLADLKELKVFDLAMVSSKMFGRQEALWMVGNWPKLLQVYGKDIPATFQEALLAKRPLVEISPR